ncbi:MAG TPA: serine protease, partial [Phycisphaerae bacterium]|nr:serine protease [Phycisphaerae bacterium]
MDDLTAETAEPAAADNLQQKIGPGNPFHSADELERWIAAVKHQVCRVRCVVTKGEPKHGTGFLVAADLVLTNYHVVRPYLEGHVPATAVTVCFDYLETASGRVPLDDPGAWIAIDPEWAVPNAPYSQADLSGQGSPAPDELDFALLKLTGCPGHAMLADEARVRGWIDVSADVPVPLVNSPAWIVQHPDMGSGQLTVQVAQSERSFSGLNANGTRIIYRTSTLGGSSGSPVFDDRLRAVAVHHAETRAPATDRTNQGIPLAAIRAALPDDVRQLLVAPPPRPLARPPDFLGTYIFEDAHQDNPATLLNARYRIVPFFDDARSDELASLADWCAAPARTAVRLFVGDGGAGKTRLFIEWCKRQREAGWAAGFLPDPLDDEAHIQVLLATPVATLAVIDYAAGRPGLAQLLKRIAARPRSAEGRLRIVLLARDVGDWWRALLQLDDDVRYLLSAHEPTTLNPLPLGEQLREAVFTHAAAQFAALRGKPQPAAQPNLSDPLFGRMLYVHAAALAAVEGWPIGANSLLDEIVTHEKHFWIRGYPAELADALPAAEFAAACSRFVAAVTLRGGCESREEAEDLSTAIRGPQQADFVPFMRWLYPAAGDAYLSGLEPDLLGETLVASVLTSNPAPTFLDRAFAGADEDRVHQGFTVLGRLSRYRPAAATP